MGGFRWGFAVALFALSGAAAARDRADDVEIRYTEYGVAHIEADIERPLVLLASFRTALKHAAIDHKTDIARFNEGAGTGHFTGRSEKPETHVFIPPDLA